MSMNDFRVLVFVAIAGALCGGLIQAAEDHLVPTVAGGPLVAVGGCSSGPQDNGDPSMEMLQSGSESADGYTRSDACNSAQGAARGNEYMCDAGEELHVSTCECVRDADAGLWSCEAGWSCVAR